MPYLIAIMGPTGSGKSALAELLAEHLDAQLINADAFQVYKGFDIGTNKPTNKSLYELLDIKSPEEFFGAGEWVLRTVEILEELWSAQRHAIVVGGTGYYIRALFEEWQDLYPLPDSSLRQDLIEKQAQYGLPYLVDLLKKRAPEMISGLDTKNPARVLRALEKVLGSQNRISFTLPPFKKFKFGIEVDVEILNEALDKRTLHLLESGWVKEVKQILSEGITLDAPAMRAIGYCSVANFLENKLTFNNITQEIQVTTKQYAKRQRSWLRSEPNLIWYPIDIETEEGNIYKLGALDLLKSISKQS